MPLAVYDTKEAVPADLVPDYAEHDGKWMHAVAIDAIKAKGKQAELVNEKAAEKVEREKAERERDDFKQKLSGKESGIEEEKLEAYAKPLRDQIASKDTIIAEKDAKILRLTRDAQADALIDSEVIAERFSKDLRRLWRENFKANEKDELVHVDANGNATAKSPSVFRDEWLKENEFLKRTDPASGGGGRTSTPGATGTPPANGGRDHGQRVAASF